MENKRKALTLRVSPELKFQMEKAAAEDGFSTINSWMIYIIKGHLEKRKKIR
jgi:predicted HicB family RNase H-like nuclease